MDAHRDDADAPAGVRELLVGWGETRAPEPVREVVVGPLAFELCGAGVEHLNYDGVEVLRGLAVIVRDGRWGTVAPTVEHCRVTGTAGSPVIELQVRHRDAEVDFRWVGRLEAHPDGLTATFEGTALREFARNRIGWCLLHPLRLAGTPVTVTSPDGVRCHDAFPDRISPHQPLRDIHTMTYRDAASTPFEVSITVEGDVFETEDQRNWTDASYKTYSTPLDLPFPVRLTAGDAVAQSVHLHVRPDRPVDPPARTTRGPSRPEPVRVGPPAGRRPLLGHTVPRRLTGTERARLAALRPGFLHAEIRPATGTDPTFAADEARSLGVPLRLDLVIDDPADLAAASTWVREHAARVGVVRPFDARTHVTTAELASVTRNALRGTGIVVGGGTRAHFAELNRATELPLTSLEEIGYSISAEMHAVDRGTVRETLLAQPDTVRDARRIADGRPVVVGPVGFKPRFNAVADAAPPARGAGVLPPEVDPRQAAVFGAAWTVGALAALSSADGIVLHDAVGRRGIAADAEEPAHADFPAAPGCPFPLYAVLTAAAPFAAGRTCEVETPTGTSALAIRAGDEALLLVANLRDEPVRLALDLPSPFSRARSSVLGVDHDAVEGWAVRHPGDDGADLLVPAPGVAICTTDPTWRTTARAGDG